MNSRAVRVRHTLEANGIVIEGRSSFVFPDDGDQITILPLGDLQLDPRIEVNGRVLRERNADLPRFKRAIEWGLAHNAYFIGMGDYVDVASPSNRRAIKQAGLYDSVMAGLEKEAYEMQAELEAVLEPTRGRWLGLLEGHHMWPYQTGQTTDTMLAEYLGCPFLGTSAMVDVWFKTPENKKKTPRFTIWAHHGRGGGTMLGSPINKLQRMTEGFDADVYLVGHHHKVVSAKSQVIHLEHGRPGSIPVVSHRDTVLTSTGSFLRGYMQGAINEGRAMGTYAEQGMMTPLALGAVAVYARLETRPDGNQRVKLDYGSIS